MATPAPTSSLFGGAIGALQQLINELASRVAVPFDAPLGDVFEPVGAERRAGADAVERLVDTIAGRRDVDPQAARRARPLLHSTTVTGVAGDATRLRVDATAPGADWSCRGAEAAMVAVYVGGRYHSTIVVHGERRGTYDVNLGQLPPGRHDVELRAATDAAPIRAVVNAANAVTSTGDQALVDRHSPVLELRDTDRGAGNSAARGDVPMLVVPALTRHADGTRTIEYRVVFSNEDAGHSTPDLLAKYGRSVDAEPLLRVRVAADGRVLEETYQATLHRWLPFDGARVAGRPVLRVSTANNMVSARTSTRPSERWSDAPTAPVDPGSTEFDAMREHPWTWAVMARELLREGKAAAADAVRGARQVADPRRYVYLGPLSDAARAAIALAGGLELVMADGRRVLATVADRFASGHTRQTALELPDGATADAVRAVALLGVRAVVLDPAFAMRDLVQLG